MRRLSDPLPLRSTDTLGRYMEPQPIPIGYGRVEKSEPVPYSTDGKTWIWLDGVNGGVDSVTIDGTDTAAWDSHNGVDDTGKPATFIVFSRAQTGLIRASGRGRIGVDGTLIENAADVISDIFTLYGRTAPDLSRFRASAVGFKVSGLFAETITGRAAVTEVCESIGAKWSLALRDFAVFYPGDATSGDRPTVRGDSATWQRDEYYSVVRVKYDWDTDKPRRVLQYEAPYVLGQIGERIKEIDARWIRSPRDAEALARLHILKYARPTWLTSAHSPDDIQAGQWVDITWPIVGTGFVLSSALDVQTGGRSLLIESAIGSSPQIRLRQLATAFDPEPDPVNVERGGDTLYVYAYDYTDNPAGDPLSGARVTHLGSGASAVADGSGRAGFAAHLLPSGSVQSFLFEADGYSDSTVTMTV